MTGIQSEQFPNKQKSPLQVEFYVFGDKHN